jgi:hypothetical protein
MLTAREEFSSVLEGAFGAGAVDNVTFITDSVSMLTWLWAHGATASHLSEYEPDVHERVVLVCSSWEEYRKIDSLRVRFGRSAVLWVPVGAFGSSDEVAKYTLDRLFRSRLTRCVDDQLQWRDTLAQAAGPLMFSGPGTEIKCTLADRVKVGTLSQCQLRAGDFRSIGHYYEVGLEIVDAEETAFFTVDGVLEAPGILVARNARFADAKTPTYAQALYLQQQTARSGSGVRMVVEGNRVVSLTCGGSDWLPIFTRLTGDHNVFLTEFAIGVNQMPVTDFDWSMNSQMNEGAAGIHIGLGDGISGVHVDFICPTAELN